MTTSVDNKIPDVSGLVQITDYDAKIYIFFSVDCKKCFFNVNFTLVRYESHII